MLVEGDRSDCHLEVNSTAQSRRLECNGGYQGFTVLSVTHNTVHDCLYFSSLCWWTNGIGIGQMARDIPLERNEQGLFVFLGNGHYLYPGRGRRITGRGY